MLVFTHCFIDFDHGIVHTRYMSLHLSVQVYQLQDCHKWTTELNLSVHVKCELDSRGELSGKLVSFMDINLFKIDLYYLTARRIGAIYFAMIYGYAISVFTKDLGGSVRLVLTALLAF